MNELGGLARAETSREPPLVARVVDAGREAGGLMPGDSVVVGRHMRRSSSKLEALVAHVVLTRGEYRSESFAIEVWRMLSTGPLWALLDKWDKPILLTTNVAECVKRLAHELRNREKFPIEVWDAGDGRVVARWRAAVCGVGVHDQGAPAQLLALPGQPILRWTLSEPSAHFIMAPAHNAGTFNVDLTDRARVTELDAGVAGLNLGTIVAVHPHDQTELSKRFDAWVGPGSLVLYEKYSAVESMSMCGVEGDGTGGPRCAAWLAELGGDRGSYYHVVELAKITLLHTGGVRPGELR